MSLSQPPASLDAKRVESVLQTAWSGKNYSARIWANRAKLTKEIQRSMMTAIHRGSSIQQLSKDLAQRMEVGYKNAERLIRTELNAVENKASADAMKDAEFTHYQFMATLDRRTCIRCGEKDGEIFALADMNQGENAPPLHPRCRCTIVATFDTPKGKSRTSGERAARETNRERAPADMSYKEWRAVYIDKTKPFDAWRAEKDAQYKADSLTSTAPSGNVSSRGLAADNINITSTKGSPPKLIEQLEKVTYDTIQKTLEHYEAQTVNATVEHVIVITKLGEVYHCNGDAHGIPFEYFKQIRDKLTGAHVTHNHPPVLENEHTFSNDDFSNFELFKMARLRGIEAKYLYELNRQPVEAELELTVEDLMEWSKGEIKDSNRLIELLAKINGYGYARWVR